MQGESRLDLGPDVVQRFLPHRRPFLFVDRVSAFRGGTRPTLRALRWVSANDPVFEGHLPGREVWPGVLTIEGMGQASLLLATFASFDQALVERGRDLAVLLDGLAALEARATWQPFRSESVHALEALIAEVAEERVLGTSAAVDVKLTAPVFPGQLLTYDVTLTHRMDSLARFAVRAEVGDREVARGTMTGSFRGLRRDRALELRA
jgi:3-hydroxymyristoyl/3-hydroxydecanoyl-(acyl carrier protein) dehydratase